MTDTETRVDRRKRPFTPSASDRVEFTHPSSGEKWVGHPGSDDTWKGFGLCHQSVEVAEMLYSVNTGVAEAAATQYCSFCPARNACLEAGVAKGEQYGVWGGLHAESAEFRGLVAVRWQATAPALTAKAS